MPEKQNRSRIEVIIEPEEVEVKADYMIDYFNQLLWSAQRVSYQDIQAWCNLSGIELTGWEFEALSAMFPSYYSMLHEATDPNCLSPLLSEQERIVQLAKINMRKMDGK